MYPPEPMTGPGESPGAIVATIVVNPTKDSVQPNERMIGLRIGSRANSHVLKIAIEITR